MQELQPIRICSLQIAGSLTNVNGFNDAIITHVVSQLNFLISHRLGREGNALEVRQPGQRLRRVRHATAFVP